jgi:hypothetical protein
VKKWSVIKLENVLYYFDVIDNSSLASAMGTVKSDATPLSYVCIRVEAASST